jgi:hypothetical protein
MPQAQSTGSEGDPGWQLEVAAVEEQVVEVDV